MNAKQRNAIARRLAGIVQAHGGTVEIEQQPEHRCTHLAATFPEIRVSVDIDDVLGGGLMAHWHRAERPLRLIPSAFDSINTHHRTKGTTYRTRAEDFYAAFERACAAVADGSAFAPYSFGEMRAEVAA